MLYLNLDTNRKYEFVYKGTQACISGILTLYSERVFYFCTKYALTGNVWVGSV